MAIQAKICILLVVLLMVVVQSKSAESNPKKGSGTSDSKGNSKDSDKDKDEQTDENKQRTQSRRRYYYLPADYLSDLFRFLPRPSPNTPSADSGTYGGNDPTCHSLIDSQYPLFSDLCGVLPQIRYSLPNSLGHSERWQIAQVLSTLLGTSTPQSSTPTCTRSLRLLICPLLFPPCPAKHEPERVLPCQPFCRIVKNQCTAPALDLLPCDFLPATSKLCPVNTSPYSPLVSTFAQQGSPTGGVSPISMSQNPVPSYLAQSALALALGQSSYGVPGQQQGAQQNPMSNILQQQQQQQSMAPSGFSIPSGRSTFGVQVPYNQQYNVPSYTPNNINPVLLDFPPLTYANQYGQPTQYFPRVR